MVEKLMGGRGAVMMLALVFVILYIVPLGGRPLFTPDETRYAEIPREMIESGNWVVPHLGGLRYFEKPSMGYWFNAVSLTIFGENEFAVRFASSFCTGMAALMLFWFIAVMKGRREALWTTMIFLTCSLVYFIGTFAVLDPHLSLFTTGALIFFYLAYSAKGVMRKCSWLAAFGVCCGFAFMTKGFVGFVIPGLTIASFLAWNRKWKEMLWMPWIPLIVAIVVSLPWAILIHGREPDFWRYFVVVEHFDRAFKADSGQHPEPFWYFIPVIIGGSLPWVLTLPGICTVLKPRLPEDDLAKYCLCWLVFPFLFFSASSGKLGTYILPCFPAVAYLFQVGLNKYFTTGNKRVFDITCRVFSIILFVAAGGFALAQILSDTGVTAMVIERISGRMPKYTALYRHGETWKWIVAVAATGFWAWCMRLTWKATGTERKMFYFFIGSMLVFIASHLVVPELIIKRKAPGAFLMEHRDRIPEGAKIVVYKNLFPEACWYYKRSDIYVFHKGGELGYGLGEEGVDYPDASHRLVSIEEFQKWTEDPANAGKLVFIMRSKRFREHVPPAKVFEVYDKDEEQIMFGVY